MKNDVNLKFGDLIERIACKKLSVTNCFGCCIYEFCNIYYLSFSIIHFFFDIDVIKYFRRFNPFQKDVEVCIHGN